MKRIAIVTEADERVASGHLMECIVCADTFLSAGYEVLFYINKEAAAPLKERIPVPYLEYEGRVGDASDLIEKCKLHVCGNYLFNLRKIENAFLGKFKREIPDCKVICVDEWGHRKLDCSVIVNPMIDPYYWKYPDSCAQKYFGEKYLVLFPELADYHKREKTVHSEIRKIVITMGGVDPYGYSLILAKWLPERYKDWDFDFVLGRRFKKTEEIKSVLKKYANVNVYHNIPFLYRLIYEADLVFCAGGNTLHETAAIGTPALIFPGAGHEVRNADMFIGKGFGRKICAKRAVEFEIINSLSEMEDKNVRKEISDAGKRMIDGMGAQRMLEIMESVSG